jgi:hypothetical protein
MTAGQMSDKKGVKRTRKEHSAEQITAEEALRRMRSFTERKEKFVAAVKKSKDRNLPTGKRK